MTPDRFQQVMSLFDAACQLPQGERSAFLRLRCADDADIRAEVLRMLEHDREPTRVLAADAVGEGMRLLAREIARTELTAGSAQEASVEMPQPARLGRYRILRKLGEGGFGVVWLAEQENPRRTVALKVIKSHLASPQLFKRFEYEAQLLGRLQHPGIAQVYEAGTTDGPQGRQAFFALEYIEGLPLDDYARQRQLGLPERLELFARVCDAVHYAHQRGVIHRDLKPANILVTDHGEALTTMTTAGVTTETRTAVPAAPRARSRLLSAQPKILDFGVARTTDDHADDLTSMRTSTGQLIGTLPYMSPEQVQGDPREIDTRSDVYALGVVLYRMLTGRLPHDLRSCSVPEAARKIRDESPTRLGSIDRSYRGDVEVIVSKALEKDKNRRYQSAADLAADLRRYVAGEPIEAKKDSALYVLRTTLRRYRSAVVVAGAFLVFIIGFAIYAGVQSRSFRLIAEREARAGRDAIESLKLAQSERRRADLNAERLETELAVSNIERGRLFGRTGAVTAAESLIWKAHLAHPESPHTYWALWELYAREPWLATIRAHALHVIAVRFSPDGRSLLSLGHDGQLRIWDTADWSPRCTLDAHSQRVQYMDLSPDGTRVLTSGRDGRVVLWEVADGERLHIFDGYAGENAFCLFGPDGRFIFICQQDDPLVWIYDATSYELVRTLRVGPRGPGGLAFAPDGRTLAVSVRDGTIRIWDDPVADGLERSVWRIPAGGAGRLQFSPDGSRLFAAGDDRVLRVWDVSTGDVLRTLQSPNDTVGDLRFAADGSALLSRGWWSVNFWDPERGVVKRSITSPDGSAGFDRSHDGRWLAVGGASGSIRIFELQPEGAFVRFEGGESRCVSRLSADGRTLVGGDARGMVRLWDVETGRVRAAWRAHNGRVHVVRFDPSGRRLATSGADRALRIWDLETLDCIDSFGGHHTRTTCAAAWSPDGKLLAFIATDNSLRIADAQDYAEIRTIPLGPGEPLSVTFSHRGDVVATVSRDAPIRVWTLEGELLAELYTDLTAWTVEFSPDDELLACGTWAFDVDVFEWRRGLRIAKLEGHTATVWSVQFHPRDPRLLVSTGSDGTVRLFDIYEQRSLLTLDTLNESEVLSLSFCADGGLLAAANSLGENIVWNLRYFDAHIAGQVDYQVSRFRDLLGAQIDEARLHEWSERVRAEARLAAQTRKAPTR